MSTHVRSFDAVMDIYHIKLTLTKCVSHWATVILLPSADLFKKGCCQLQVKVCAQITG